MFKLARLILFVGFGFYLGTKYSALAMQSECSTVGDWNNGLCLVTELPQ